MQVKFKSTSVIKARLGIENGGPVHAFFTETCAKAMDKYVPFDTGTLAETVVLKSGELNHVNISVDTITYNTKYAKYPYYGITHGKLMNFNKEKHILATRYWDKAMWTAEGKDIVRQVQEFLDKYAGGK